MKDPKSKPLSRRGFLGVAGLTGGGLALSGCHDGDPYALEKPEVPGARAWLKGEERWISTSCAQCPAECGIRARVVEGRLVKVEGDPACPVNEGGIGPRGLAGPQVLYDPDRVTSPLRRVGARGSGKFEPVSWDVALEELGTHLAGLRERGEAHRLAVVSGRPRGMMAELFERFARAFGTPNVYGGITSGDLPVAQASHLMQGIRELPAYDWPGARCILSLGSGVLESSCQQVYFSRAQSEDRRGDRGGRARIIHCGPVYTRTAMNADEWIPVRVGTYAAFALAIAHILVRDGLHDQDFVKEHCFGFEPWEDDDGVPHFGFRALLQDYAPEEVAPICGIQPRVLERIARVIGESRPCFAIAGSEELLASNGLQTAMAVHALNALLGAIDRPGGLLTQRAAPLEEWPELELDEIAEAGLEHPRLGTREGRLFPLGSPALETLPEAILADDEYTPDTLLLYYANPLYARGQRERWELALRRVPLVVSFSPFLDETAAEVADWVLPDDSYLERWEDATPAPSVGYPIFGIRQPVVERLYDTSSTGDVLIQLAAGIGGAVQEALPWKDFKDALKKRVIGLYKAKRGSIVEAKGSDFLSRFYDAASWFEPGYTYERWDEVLKTPTGRFEFYSTRIHSAITERAAALGTSVQELLEELHLVPDPERVCMPRHDEIHWAGNEQRFPLLLIPYRPSTYAEGSGANLPWLQELRFQAGRSTWTTEAEIHPATARAHDIAAGDLVAVESEAGSIEARAFVTPGVSAGLVRIAQGGGHRAFGRYARGWGANVMDLVQTGKAQAALGIPSLTGTRVRVRRIS